MKRCAPAVAIVLLMVVVCVVAYLAPYAVTGSDRVVLALSAICSASIPVGVLCCCGFDAVKPTWSDDQDDNGPYTGV